MELTSRSPRERVPRQLEAAVRAIRRLWPRAVFENGTTGESYDQFHEIPFGLIDEIFVYMDSHFADIWDSEGAIPETANSMVHLIAEEGLVTVVVDERDAMMETILAAIRSGQDDEIHFIRAVAA